MSQIYLVRFIDSSKNIPEFMLAVEKSLKTLFHGDAVICFEHLNTNLPIQFEGRFPLYIDTDKKKVVDKILEQLVDWKIHYWHVSHFQIYLVQNVTSRRLPQAEFLRRLNGLFSERSRHVFVIPRGPDPSLFIVDGARVAAIASLDEKHPAHVEKKLKEGGYTYKQR